MKRCVLIVATLAFLIYPSICTPSYVIELKSGRQLVVYEHWEEGSEIRFYFHGGVVAIPKHLVRSISESDMQYGEAVSFAQDIVIEENIDRGSIISSSIIGETQVKKDSLKKETDSQKKKKDGVIEFEYYKGRKLLLKAKLNDSMERFLEASGNKDAQAKMNAIQNMTEISGQIFDLADELEEQNNQRPGSYYNEEYHR